MITIQEIKAAVGLRRAALLHCKYFYNGNAVWDKVLAMRDAIIDSINPEWPHDEFWAEVDSVCSDHNLT